MSLEDFLAEMGAQRRTVTVYSDDPDPEIPDRFRDWNVELRFNRLPEGSHAGFVTVRQGTDFLAGVDSDVLSGFFEPTRTIPGSDAERDPALTTFLDHFDETLFHGTTRRQLLAASREFEDRAWRVGSGRLYAGFQRPAALEAQRSPYQRLADRGLDVHVYFDGDWDTATIPGVRMHVVRNDEIGRFWFVAFDGGPESLVDADLDRDDHPTQACALLAKETGQGTYSGFWTYDPERVASLLNYLEATYR
ncbi:DICT sensory domain-containing protein [Halorientalis salina]|uniref:DICT sensory domain-containing protein n=1 Tax=Halorientalis salina TaxID=2932266 RepID=UPI0020229D4D|nr:DICT sensory domain-containing protein [Halorientalis salina]